MDEYDRHLWNDCNAIDPHKSESCTKICFSQLPIANGGWECSARRLIQSAVAPLVIPKRVTATSGASVRLRMRFDFTDNKFTGYHIQCDSSGQTFINNLLYFKVVCAEELAFEPNFIRSSRPNFFTNWILLPSKTFTKWEPSELKNWTDLDCICG